MFVCGFVFVCMCGVCMYVFVCVSVCVCVVCVCVFVCGCVWCVSVEGPGGEPRGVFLYQRGMK